MRPGFREALPGVGAGVATNGPILPAGLAPFCIVGLQGGSVIVSFIAELIPKSFVPYTTPYKSLPIIVARLMTEMSKEGAVGFRQVSAMTFAFRIIGLRDIFGNQSLAMACDNLWAFSERRARTREKIKRKSLLGVVELVD